MLTVVFIDDEPDVINDFADALRRKKWNGKPIGVVVLSGRTAARKALQFFLDPQPDVLAVVLDLMMPPVDEVAADPVSNGHKTGLVIRTRIWSQQQNHRMGGRLLPIGVLTQITDQAIHQELEDDQVKNHPAEKYRLWSKHELTPSEFSVQFIEWLESLKELHGWQMSERGDPST